MISEGVPALTRGRISHVDQNYVRLENYAAANATLIAAQAGDCPRNCVGPSERDRYAYDYEKQDHPEAQQRVGAGPGA